MRVLKVDRPDKFCRFTKSLFWCIEKEIKIMGIQLFKAKYEVDECLAEIRECLEVGWTGMGFKTVKFEEAWKGYTGLPFAHYLNSSTIGLYMAVNILKEQYG